MMKSLTNNAFFANLNPELFNFELLDALKNNRNYLRSLATNSDFVMKMQVAFGNSFNLQKVEELAVSWVRGDLGYFPPIEIRDAAEINGARGAFSAATNTIYLSREFVRENEGNGDAIAAVLLEEYGHYIDSQINTTDTPGDEGEIFAVLAQGKVLSESELAALKGEDDSAIALLDGQWVRIEQAETKIETDRLDFSATDINLGSNIGLPRRLPETNFLPSANINESGNFDNLIKFNWNVNTSAELIPFLDLGEIGNTSFSYPLNVDLAVPKNLEKDESFSISFLPIYTVQGGKIEGSGLKLPQAGIDLKYNVGRSGITNIVIPNPLGDAPFQPENLEFLGFQGPQTVNLVTQNLGELANFNFDVGKFGNISFKIPENLNPSGNGKNGTPGELTSISTDQNNRSNLANLQLDLDAIAGIFFPALQLLGNEIVFPKNASQQDEDKSRYRIDFSYDLLDIKANLEYDIQQNFTFDPNNVKVTISVEGQPDQIGNLGDPNTNFTFKAPSEGCGLLEVKVKYELLGNAETEIGLIPRGSLDLKGLDFKMDARVGNIKFPTIDPSALFGPTQFPEGGLVGAPIPLVGKNAPIQLDPVDLSIIGQEDVNKNFIIEKTYKIPYNLPITISDASVTEGNSGTTNVVFTVSRREASNEPLILEYSITDGSATAGRDYFQATNSIVVIPAGQVSADITIPVVGDTEKEGTETFTVTVKDPSDQVFAECKDVDSVTATGTIIDDDEKPEAPRDRGYTFNDPRYITFDRQYHDFQAVGEFVLVESTSGDLKIQVRQEAVGSDRLGSVAENTAVATVLAGQRIGIYRDRGLLINGNPTTIADNDSIIIGDGRIFREGNIYTIVYATGDQLVATVGNRVNISFFAKEERQGQIKGLLGNFNRDPKDDLAKRDGMILTPPVTLSQLYNEYGDSWRITQVESLFDYQPGEDTNTFTNRNFPRQKVTLRDLDPADVLRAEQAIGDRITDPTIREATIIDYILTGFDETIIEAAIASPIPESILIIATPPRAFEDFSATKVNTPVKINVLSNDEGTIGVPLAIANFDSTTTKGGSIQLDDNATPDNKNDDRLIYTPPANFTDVDTFNYTVSDGKDSSTTQVTVFVNAPFPPSPAEDFSSTAVNTPVTIDVLSNDISLENLPLIIANFDQTSTAGSIIKLDDNNTPDDQTDDQLIYTPTANFTGNDTFNYTVTDGAQTSTAKVTVNIATFNLSNLDGSNGFILNGITPGNFAGVSVNTLGDFNGDGFNDFIIGAFAADPNNNNAAGETYVIFGKQGGFPASIDLPNLDGSNGFILNGVDTNGFSGGSVSSAGDINGDGLDDLVIGAFGATVNGQNNAGKSYVVFGSKAVFPVRLNLSNLNGNNGFVVNGTNEFDYLGLAVSGARDINADGIDDLLVSAPGPLNGTLSKSYVIYGQKGNFAASLNASDINGNNGFVINDTDGKSGTSVSAAGDINGDGIDDIIINAEENDSNNYVIFGSANGFPGNFNLSELNGSNGFILDTGNEKSGTTVSKAGDINGDTIDDLIISLASSDSNVGKSYILFGSNREFAPRFDVSQLNGRNGFVLFNNIDGTSIGAVSSAGDINGDGIDDLAIATSQANFNAGKTYILFGDNAGFTPSFYLSQINGTNGLVINGIKENDLSGTSLSQGGDINGDNIDDLVIGSPGNLFNNSPGQTHVVFGSTLFGSSKDPSNLAKLLFDSSYYLTQNPDVRTAVSNGIFRNGFEHFINFGLTEGREPSATFAGDYLTNNPDVADAVSTEVFSSGVEHFVKFGLMEGRQPDSILGSLVALDVFYRSENPDVVQAIQQGILSSGLEHLIQFGMLEGRLPFTRFKALSETFDADFYLRENPDVKQAVDSGIIRNAWEHFVNLGLIEGRDPSNQFSNRAYLANYPDIADAVSNGFFRSGYEHFINYGFGEERVGVAIGFG